MSKLCFGCMQQKEESPICEHCGFDEQIENQSHQLSIGTLLQNQYLVGRVLGQGGFGITYMGWDQHLSVPVAIKEYYPSSVVQRHTKLSTKVSCSNGAAQDLFIKHRDRFLKEARTLAQLADIPEIVEIHSFFPENDTAYIVMEYVHGVTLKEYVKKLGRHMTEAEVLATMEPVLKALQKVHDQGLIHRDISPDNIMLPHTGGVKIIDFGTVRYIDNSDKSKSTETVLKPGFAPMEQYATRGHLGTWSDVYALCATFHYLLTGKVPEEAMARLDGDGTLPLLRSKKALSPGLIEALEKGMQVRIPDRIQTVEELYQLLYCDKTRKPFEPVAPGAKTLRRHKVNPKKKLPLPLMAASGLAALALGFFLTKAPAKETVPSPELPEDTMPTVAMQEQTTPQALPQGMNEIEIRYSEAAALAQEGKTAQAAIAFGKLGNYRDSRERSFALWDDVAYRETLVPQLFHTVGLRTDGTVLAAGRNDYGQCDVEDWTDIIAISASSYHTVGLKADGTVVAVGMNGHGQCDVEGWTNIVAILAEDELFTEQNGEIPIGYTVGLKSDGTLVTTGSNTRGQCDVSHWTDVIRLDSDTSQCNEAKASNLVGLRTDGTILIAGDNYGNWCDPISQWTDIVSFSICAQHIVGLKSDGTTVYASTDQEDYGFYPNRYDASGWENITHVYSATGHTLGLREDGTVIAYGNDDHYDHSSVSRWQDIVALCARHSYTVGLKSDGTVVGVGYDNEGQAKGFSTWRDIVAVYTSSIHTVGLRADGTAVAAGFNVYGQCDISHWTNLIVPD